jgi:hypothetical protein
MNPVLLLWPMVLHAFATLFLYFPMSRARVASVRRGDVAGSVYKLNLGEPEESLRFSNAIRNQNETGVLFYAACLTIYVTDGASFMTAALAWLFAAAKILHVVIHVTSNRLRYRRPAFTVACVILILLWLALALHLAGIF